MCNSFSLAQVGVNSTVIDASAALDVQYGTSPKGLLTPRMTTDQRNGIANPATGLLVFDTDLKSFYYNEGTPTAPAWTIINSGAAGRTNFKRIKSIADLAAEKVGSTYVLKTDTYYEINGPIAVDFPIDLNNAYIVGLDANEDKLVRSEGTLFSGTSGGTIKNLSLVGKETGQGATLFSLDGTATQAGVNAQNLLIRDCIVQQFTSIGIIKGFGLVFSSVVQYVGNGDGVIYDNITRLLLNNIGWFGNNGGTFEKYTGTFNLIQKLGGFMDLTAGTYGIDVQTNPKIIGDAVLESVVFTGDSVTGAKYVNKYTTGSYANFNFTNQWTVDSPGIPRESDGAATANLYKKNNATAMITNVSATDPGSAINTGNNGTIATNLFRFQANNAEQLTYTGKKSRAFQATATLSFNRKNITGNNTTFYVFYFVKISGSTITPLPETETYIDANRDQVVALPISGTIVLANGDSVQLYVKRISGNIAAIDVYSYNLSLK